MLCNYRGVRCVLGRVNEPGPHNFRAQRSLVPSARRSSVSKLQHSSDPDGPNALPWVPPVLGCPPRKQRPSLESRTLDWSQARSVCWALAEHRGRGRSPQLLPRSQAPGLGREPRESPLNMGREFHPLEVASLGPSGLPEDTHRETLSFWINLVGQCNPAPPPAQLSRPRVLMLPHPRLGMCLGSTIPCRSLSRLPLRGHPPAHGPHPAHIPNGPPHPHRLPSLITDKIKNSRKRQKGSP